MSAQTADFAVLRNGANWRCSGSNLKTRLLSTDKVVITRGSTTGLCDPFAVQPTDWLAATDTDGETYKVAGSKFLELITPDAPTAGESLFTSISPITPDTSVAVSSANSPTLTAMCWLPTSAAMPFTTSAMPVNT